MIRLDRFDNSWYRPGGSPVSRTLWFFLGAPLLRCSIQPTSAIRRGLLRMFGAKVGQGVVIKPGVRVKYPWRLRVGDHAWIGEDVWIDNLADIELGSHSCVSQGAYLCTGNHDWSDPNFGLRVEPITIGEGAWVGAKATVCPGISLGNYGVLTAGSIAVRPIPKLEIHAGNPAEFIRSRRIGEKRFDGAEVLGIARQ